MKAKRINSTLKHPVSMKKLIVTLMLTGIVNIPLSVYGQCKGFVKKTCIPMLSPFISNGTTNTAALLAGDKADMNLTFYSGQTYRVLVCAQPVLGIVSFTLKDASGNLLFDSKAHDDTNFWDFKAETTQQITISVEVPKTDASNQIVPSGCVSVMIGFQPEK